MSTAGNSQHTSDDRVRRRSVAGNALWLAGAQGATWCLGIVLAVALARYLGPALVGQLYLAISLWTVAGVLVAAGTHILLTKEFARDPSRGSSLLGPATSLQLLAYVTAWLVVLGFALVAGYDRSVVSIIAIVGISIVFQPLAGSARAALHGLERMEYVAIGDVATKVVHVAIVLLLIALAWDVRAIAAASAIHTLSAAALLVFFLGRLGVLLRPRLHGVIGVFKKSRPYLLIGITLTMYQQIDIIVISLLVQDEVMGWYSSADRLFSSLLFLPVILMTSLFPAFSRLHSTDPASVGPLLRRSFNVLLLVAVPVGLGTAILAHPAVILLFGSEFAEAGTVLAILGVVSIVTYLTILLGHYAMAIDRQNFWIGLMAIATVSTVGLDLLLIPLSQRQFGNGAIGGALAYLVTEGGMLAIGLWKLAPQLIRRETAVRVIKSGAVGATMVVAVWPLRWQVIPIPIVVGMVTYALALAVFRVLEPAERDLLFTTLARLARPRSRIRGIDKVAQ